MLLCIPAIEGQAQFCLQGRRFTDNMKKPQSTREETEGETERERERERGSFCTFVKAVPLLTLEEFDGPKLSIPHNGLPQRCLDA